MKTVFIWLFVGALQPAHPNFQRWVDAHGDPSIVGSETVASERACQRIMDDLERDLQGKAVDIYVHKCIEVSFPTRPETSL